MKKLTAALVLALLITTSTTATIVEPIKPISPELFTDIAVQPIKPKEIAEVIVDVRSSPSPTRPTVDLPESPVIVVEPTKAPTSTKGFRLDPEVSWYGPGFYGRRTACGLAYTKTIIGFAHKTLPCGTLITFKWGNHIVVAPVIDRGPYVSGRQFDLSGALCTALDHCFTGPLYYAMGSH